MRKVSISLQKIIIIFNEFKNISQKQGFWYAIYFSLFFINFYNPLLDIGVTKFNRVIGEGVLLNVDVSKRIVNFKMLFIFFGILFVLFSILLSYLKLKKNSNKENKIVFKFLDNFIVLANIQIFFQTINYFNIKKNFSYSSYFVMLIILIGLAYILFDFKKYITPENYLKIIILYFICNFFVSILIRNMKLLLIIQVFSFLFLILLLRFDIKNIVEKIINNGIVTITLIPLLTSLFIELVNILNQHDIFVSNPRKWYVILMTSIFFIFFVGVFFISSQKIKLKKWKDWTYPVLILGITSLSVQLPLQSTYNPNIFESANSSILISDFLNYNSIPIIEHYGGHMMSNVWEGIIYAVLNKDVLGGSLSPYSVYFTVMLAILFYYFVKNIWNEEMALLTVLVFPFYNYWYYFGLGILIYFAIMSYIKKISYKNAILIWLSIIWCILYRMDLGYAFGISAVITLVFYIFKTKKWDSIKYLSYSLIVVTIVSSILYLFVCINKDINPIDRLLEFLKISLSNSNWAYASIGDIQSNLFLWVYIVVPFVMIICLLLVIFSKKLYVKFGTKIWLLLLLLGVSYFINFSRLLVRHSMVEMDNIVTMWTVWTAWAFFAVFFSYIKGNKKYFISIFTILVFLNTVFFERKDFYQFSIIDNVSLKISPIVESWVKKDNNQKTVWQNLSENKIKVKRVKLSAEIKNTISEYENVIETLLEKDETFVDFINKTLLYSILNKKNPVYISQSPLQLSGEFTQMQFIKQIKGIPIIFMPVTSDDGASISLDGIANNYRYYKVSEYIYQNYKPLLKSGQKFSVWCLKEKCEVLRKKAEILTKNKNYDVKKLINPQIITKNSEILIKDKKVIINSVGVDPVVENLQSIVNLHDYVNENAKLTLDYSSNIEGEMQLFYTTDENESYSENKTINNNINKAGKAEFIFPVTSFTKLRLDIPEKSTVSINSINLGSTFELIDYGYDVPNKLSNDINYIDNVHSYNLQSLPLIWAEYDIKNAASNKKLEVMHSINDELFIFNNIKMNKKNGNYILILLNYIGNVDKKNMVLKLGYYDNNGNFFEKNQYIFNLKPGKHEYLLRVSSDYYWYLNQINAVKIKPEYDINNIKMSVLEGD